MGIMEAKRDLWHLQKDLTYIWLTTTTTVVINYDMVTINITKTFPNCSFARGIENLTIWIRHPSNFSKRIDRCQNTKLHFSEYGPTKKSPLYPMVKPIQRNTGNFRGRLYGKIWKWHFSYFRDSKRWLSKNPTCKKAVILFIADLEFK